MRRKGLLAVLFVVTGVWGVAAQVQLPGGVTVPRERFILLIGAGSCNFSGVGSPLDTATDPRCWAWGTGDQSDYWGTQQWVPMKDRVWSTTNAGCGMVQIVREMAARYPDYYFGAIQYARAGAALRCGGADLSMMPANNRGYRTLMNNARALAPYVTFGFVFFQFDALESQAAQQYQDSYAGDFKTVIDSMRAGLGLTPSQLPALTNQYGANYTGVYAITTAGGARVAAQILAVPTVLSCSAAISTTGLAVTSEHHFTGTTWRQEASRAVDTLVAEGWLLWLNPTAVNAGWAHHATPAPNHRGVGATTRVPWGTDDRGARLVCLDGSLAGRCAPGAYLVGVRGHGQVHAAQVLVH
jgi:hypothetical protein